MKRASKLIERGSDIRKHWPHTNANTLSIDALADEVMRLRQLVVGQMRGNYNSGLLPFTVYSLPLAKIDLRALSEEAQAAKRETYWREFRVRHGYVMDPLPISIAGCDDADGEGTTAVVITVPVDTAEYFVWVDMTEYEIGHGAAVPASGEYRLLAKITTQASAPATVRQFQIGDIHPGGGGDGGNTWI
jgi:hypothetical protein